MEIQVLFFGSLIDVTAISFDNIAGPMDTDSLQQSLYQKYSGLQSCKYLIAVNQKMIQKNTQLKNGDTVALMPPFSGG